MRRVDCEADKENGDVEPVTRKEFAVPVQGYSALVPVQVSSLVPTVTLPEPTCSTHTLTHTKPTSGATPGEFFNISGCTVNFNCKILMVS